MSFLLYLFCLIQSGIIRFFLIKRGWTNFTFQTLKIPNNQYVVRVCLLSKALCFNLIEQSLSYVLFFFFVRNPVSSWLNWFSLRYIDWTNIPLHLGGFYSVALYGKQNFWCLYDYCCCWSICKYFLRMWVCKVLVKVALMQDYLNLYVLRFFLFL